MPLLFHKNRLLKLLMISAGCAALGGAALPKVSLVTDAPPPVSQYQSADGSSGDDVGG